MNRKLKDPFSIVFLQNYTNNDGMTGCEIRIFFHWPGWTFA